MRSQIPSFRLPDEVLDFEVDIILDMGLMTHFNHYVTSLKSLLNKDYDAISSEQVHQKEKICTRAEMKHQQISMSVSSGWLRCI